ncbi:class I SAM-dependent methyltransferase [Sulfitobacter sp. 1A12057]|uniref:class I SAM-dependent methyltransferase n=1 Tax=Sulfitobacter sp. 1A12057 TaxID=3368567 RepID=UPI00374640BB
MESRDGGYDEGYRSCACFWGNKVGSLVTKLVKEISVEGKTVLDAGCGEGKNAVALAKLGARVTAVDCSEIALSNAIRTFGKSGVDWHCGDIKSFVQPDFKFDIVLAYGLLHCLQSVEEILETAKLLKDLTAPGGWNIVCAFNNREQDLTAHPGFSPCLIPHETYMNIYRSWEVEFSSDEDLHETHPHNNIPHSHSMSRLIARKPIQ